MYFDHFPWQIYGCGTYRESPTEGHAKASFKSFLDRLERGLERQPVACIAVLEGRTSGRRSSPTPRHWHFIKAAPRRYEDALLSSVPQLWEKAYGNCKTQAYDPRLPGGSYMAKTAKNADFDWLMHNLEHLCPGQNLDLFTQQQTDPYVPDHVRGLTRGPDAGDATCLRDQFSDSRRGIESAATSRCFQKYQGEPWAASVAEGSAETA